MVFLEFLKYDDNQGFAIFSIISEIRMIWKLRSICKLQHRIFPMHHGNCKPTCRISHSPVHNIKTCCKWKDLSLAFLSFNFVSAGRGTAAAASYVLPVYCSGTTNSVACNNRYRLRHELGQGEFPSTYYVSSGK